MHTREELLGQLAGFAPRGRAVLLHSSLRAVGETEGRGEGLLDTLIEYFTADGGLLCIPTHTWTNIGNSSKPTLDMTSSETCIGTLPSLAALHPLAHRSPHPTHSMAVFDGTPAGTPGRAEDFIACEVNRLPGTLTSTSPDGCYGKLYDLNGLILLVGVGHNRDTYLHSVEERLGVPNRLTEKPVRVTVKTAEDTRELTMRCHHADGINDVSANYPKYEPAFRRYGAIVDGRLGGAAAQLCSARIMAEVLALIRGRSAGAELMGDASPLSERLYT